MKNQIKKNQILALALSVLCAVAVIVFVLYRFEDSASKIQIRSLGEKAFGSLISPTQSVVSSLSSRFNLGLGQGGEEDQTSYKIINDTGLPYIEEVVAYEYIYSGELPDLTKLDNRVYKKVNVPLFTQAVSDSIKNLSFGDLSLDDFIDLKLQGFTMAETDPNGFNIYMDTVNGSISISKNSGYPQTFDSSITLKAGDMMSDTELIEKANQFLDNFGISRSDFGNPSIDRLWIDISTWVPDSMIVVYPIKINGYEVINLYGTPVGITVLVNQRTKEVDNFFSYVPFVLESSTYEFTHDPQTILSVAQRGGVWEYQPPNPNITYTSKLGEPTFTFAEHYQVDDHGNQQIFYVPALQFPVIETDEKTPYKKPFVIVPLVLEILQNTDPVTGNSATLKTENTIEIEE